MSEKIAVILIITLLLTPALLGVYSYIFFNTSQDWKDLTLRKDAEVAGIADSAQIENLTKEIPLLPGSEIYSFTTSNNDINVIIEFSHKEEEVKSFYDDHFFKQNWQQIDKDIYQRNGKIVKLNISGNLIYISITK